MTVAKARAVLTYREFWEWVLYLDEEETIPSKMDLYLAQVAAEVRRSFVANPHQISARDFLLKFSRPEQQPEDWSMMKSLLDRGLNLRVNRN